MTFKIQWPLRSETSLHLISQLLSPHSDGIQENLTFFNNRLKKKVVQMKKVNSGGSFTELYGIKGLFNVHK